MTNSTLKYFSNPSGHLVFWPPCCKVIFKRASKARPTWGSDRSWSGAGQRFQGLPKAPRPGACHFSGLLLPPPPLPLALLPPGQPLNQAFALRPFAFPWAQNFSLKTLLKGVQTHLLVNHVSGKLYILKPHWYPLTSLLHSQVCKCDRVVCSCGNWGSGTLSHLSRYHINKNR